MSRRRAADKRLVLPDPIYNSVVLNKFINEVMVGGKKTIAQKNSIWCPRYY
jgi:small subunit ribosomal protein S7